jgi:hypothetical protein
MLQHIASQPVEQQRPMTEEKVAHTYTRLDNSGITEDFIRIAMEPGTSKCKQPELGINTDKGR